MAGRELRPIPLPPHRYGLATLRQGGAGWGLLGAIAPGQPSGWLAT